MGDSAKAPPPPDTQHLEEGTTSNANRMRNWSMEMWDTGQQEWEQMSQWTQEFMGTMLPQMEEQFGWAREQRDRFMENVMPQMQSLFKEADQYASKEEEDRQRAAAIQDVKSATEAQREAQQRKLEGYGIDPSDTRYEALDKRAGVAEAAASALAANQAGERTKQIGRDLRSEALGVGSQFLTDANASQQLGTMAGSTAMGGAAAGTASGQRSLMGALPYMGGAQAGLMQAGVLADQAYNRELLSAQDKRAAEGDMSGIGSLVGSLIGSYWGPIGSAAGGEAGGDIGGMIKTADGGSISAPGGPTDDMGAIRISDGEYVIPADVVKRLGTNHFDKMIEKETGRAPPDPKQAIPIPQGAL